MQDMVPALANVSKSLGREFAEPQELGLDVPTERRLSDSPRNLASGLPHQRRSVDTGRAWKVLSEIPKYQPLKLGDAVGEFANERKVVAVGKHGGEHRTTDEEAISAFEHAQSNMPWRVIAPQSRLPEPVVPMDQGVTTSFSGPKC